VAPDGPVTEPLDLALLAQLADVVDEATKAFDKWDYARALEVTESFFWRFCDDYIELVKGRAYGEGPAAESASRALRTALDVLLRLFAPVLPFATEEVWSWWREGSVHAQPWPESSFRPDADVDPFVLDRAARVLAEVRKAKSSAKTSQRTPVTRLVITGSAEKYRTAEADLRNAAVVQGEVEYVQTADVVAHVELGEAPPKNPHEPRAGGGGAGRPLPGRGPDGPGPGPHLDAHGPARLAAARGAVGAPHRHQRQDQHRADGRRPAAGGRLRVGRYTSPHLQSMTERITLDGVPLSDDRFTEVFDEVLPLVELVDAQSADAMTFFEVLTAMAFAAFADAPVDAQVLEVGLGGSWDATNVVHAQTCVVLPVGMDHAQLLGGTLAAIATEKAGIIHAGATAVLAQQPPEAAEVLLRRCADVGATVAREGLEFGVVERRTAVGGQLLDLQGLAGRYDDVFLPLHGAHQASNAAAALAAPRRSCPAGRRAGRRRRARGLLAHPEPGAAGGGAQLADGDPGRRAQPRPAWRPPSPRSPTRSPSPR
jgi:hypothetical protein